MTPTPARPELEAQVDPARLLEVVSTLVAETHRTEPPPVGWKSELDRDLGLDSLARAELVERLEREFAVPLANALAHAETPADLWDELRTARSRSPSSAPPAPSSVRVERSSHAPAEIRGEAEVLAENLVAALRWHARVHPERVHVELLDPDHAPEILTYGQLLADAESIALGLLERGVKRGGCVAIMLPTSLDYARTFCAALLIGAVPVPIYPPSRRTQIAEHLERQRRILDNARARVLVTVEGAVPLARLLRASLPDLRDVVTAADLRTPGTLPIVDPRPDEVAFLQYTSGSTGHPKGVVLTHRNLVANMRAMGSAIRVTTRDTMVSWLPLYHDMGLIGGWLSPLYFGFPTVLMSPLAFLSRPSRWLRAIHEHSGTISASPNFGYELCVRQVRDEELEGLDLSTWRFALNGSEAVSPRTVERFCQRFGPYGFRRTSMSPAYGLAECSVALCFPPLGRGPLVDRVLRAALAERGRAEPARDGDAPADVLEVVACGRPLHGHEARIVDPAGHELGEREEGSLEFRGPSTTGGYFRNEDATRDLFDGEWLRSGDLAYVANGDVYVTGRTKDLVIRAGRHLHPHEIEEAVGEVEGVRRGCVVVFASKDARTATERWIVVAETNVTDEAARVALSAAVNLRATDVSGMPPDEVVLAKPRSVLKTSSGKIRRAACRAAYEDGRLGASAEGAFQQMGWLLASWGMPMIRRAARRTGDWLFALRAWLAFVVVAFVTWVLALLVPGKERRLEVARSASRALFRMTGTPIETHGLENLASTDHAVLVSNHQSAIDAFVVVASLPLRFSVTAKSELARHAWVRVALARLGVQFVERRVATESVAAARAIEARTRAGETPLFFPEGTYTRLGLLPFHSGAFLLATHLGLPVIPIVLRGTRAILPPDGLFPRSGRVSVEVGAPIPPDGADWESAVRLAERVRRWMLERSGEPDLGPA
ncbi:MAG: AMP-binding protein [Polyangiales bacterium]